MSVNILPNKVLLIDNCEHLTISFQVTIVVKAPAEFVYDVISVCVAPPWLQWSVVHRDRVQHGVGRLRADALHYQRETVQAGRTAIVRVAVVVGLVIT